MNKLLLICLIFLGVSANLNAETPPNSYMNLPVSFVHPIEGTEWVTDNPETLNMSLAEFITLGLNSKAVFTWEKLETGQYVLNMIIKDRMTGKITNVKMLFIRKTSPIRGDSSSPERVLISRFIYNNYEYTRGELFKFMLNTCNTIMVKHNTQKTKNDEHAVLSHMEQPRPIVDNFSLTDTNAMTQVSNTKYYMNLKNKYSNIVMFVEDKQSQYIYIYLGFDEGSHTTRKAFVRVNSGGIIQYSEIPPADESDWKYLPNKRIGEQGLPESITQYWEGSKSSISKIVDPSDADKEASTQNEPKGKQACIKAMKKAWEEINKKGGAPVNAGFIRMEAMAVDYDTCAKFKYTDGKGIDKLFDAVIKIEKAQGISFD